MPGFRNVALVGHGDAGKTTLTEHLLAYAKAIPRAGTVQDGNTVSDFDQETKERKSSVSLGVTHAAVRDTHVNLLDAPGYPDFLGEAIAGLSVAETACICVPATSGPAVGTRHAWQLAGTLGCARAIVITKADHESAKIDETIAAVQESFGAKCVPAVIHQGTGASFTGVKPALGTADGLALTEQVVEVDDALMERYLEGQAIPPAELAAAFGAAMRAGSVVPIYIVSAEQGLGLPELADAIVDVFPAPDQVPPPKATAPGGDTPVTVSQAADGPAAARVFKVVSDPYVGRICYLRLYGGTLIGDQNPTNARTGKADRIPAYQRVQGKDLKPMDRAVAGDIVAVVKIEGLQREDTVHGPVACRIAGPAFPTPMVSRAVEPKTRGDETKVAEAIQKLVDEDPTFRFRRDPVTKEQVISGLSELHLDITLKRGQRRSKVEFATRLPRVAYRETIVGKAESRYRHRKQTGGAGQFAEVWMRVLPRERGSGFEFADETVGGSIPKQFIPSCEKGIRRVLEDGAVAGYPVVDVRAEVFDGKHHPVDSKDIAFQIAARNAFKECMRNARPVLLEPIAKVEITVPSKYMGDITSDLSARRGRMQGMDSVGDLQIVKAEVPMAEVLSYSSELRSITRGEGAYTLEESHYDVVPSNIAQGIIEAAAKTMKKDEDD